MHASCHPVSVHTANDPWAEDVFLSGHYATTEVLVSIFEFVVVVVAVAVVVNRLKSEEKKES